MSGLLLGSFIFGVVCLCFFLVEKEILPAWIVILLFTYGLVISILLAEVML
jgi:mannose/fructose/N-acetylgalactosamine-specific phosphotransferase system component IID